MELLTIIEEINYILRERGDIVSNLSADTLITQTGLDSLDIAALVVRLEERFDFDPFSDPNLTDYPKNLGDLAKLYSKSNNLTTLINT